MPTPSIPPEYVHVSDPARAAEFRACGIDPDHVPVVSIIPSLARLPGRGSSRIYLLDLRQITPEQRAALVQHLARKFSLDPAEVDRDLVQAGMPILAEHCTAVSTQPYKYL